MTSPLASFTTRVQRDQAGVAQAHLAARRQPEPVLGRVLAEVVAIDVDDARERNLARPLRRILGVQRRIQLAHLSLGKSSITSFNGRSTAITRGERRFRSSRNPCSSSPTSIRLSVLATPIRSQNARIASGV